MKNLKLNMTRLIMKLKFLQTLLETRPDLGVGTVRAIGIHRDSRSANILKAQVKPSNLSMRAREEALCWIVQSHGQSSFLSDFARDASAPLAERSAASCPFQKLHLSAWQGWPSFVNHLACG